MSSSGLLSQENVQEMMSTIDAAMVEPLEGFPEPGERGFHRIQVVTNAQYLYRLRGMVVKVPTEIWIRNRICIC